MKSHFTAAACIFDNKLYTITQMTERPFEFFLHFLVVPPECHRRTAIFKFRNCTVPRRDETDVIKPGRTKIIPSLPPIIVYPPFISPPLQSELLSGVCHLLITSPGSALTDFRANRRQGRSCYCIIPPLLSGSLTGAAVDVSVTSFH